MKTLSTMVLWVSLAATATIAAAGASVAPAAAATAADVCRSYGFVPHTHEDAVCRANVRRFWTTGPCGHSQFAAAHPRYCHLIRSLDF
jgi:hypothetical protein